MQEISASAAIPNLVLAQRDSVYNSMGIVVNGDTERMANFPLRSGAILDSVLAPLETYGQAQIIGANMMAEAAHQSPSPGVDIPKAKAYIDNVARSLQSTRAQLPDYPLNDGYLIDLQNGVQWCMTAQAPMGQTQRDNFAAAYTDGDTTGWHAASLQEIQSLLLRAGWTAGNGDSYDYQNAAQGLEMLGFDLSQVTGNSLGVTDWNYVSGFNEWGTTDQLQVDIAANLTATPPVQYTFVPPANKLSFLMCRTLGETPVLDLVPQQLGVIDGIQQQPLYGNPGSWPPTFLGSPIAAESRSVGSFLEYDYGNIPNNVIELTGTYQTFTGDADGFLVGSTSTTTQYERGATPFTGQPIPPTYYQTPDSAGVSISNYAKSFGAVIQHINATTTSTITYSTLGYDPGTDTYPKDVTGTITYTAAGTPSITLTQLQISPRNLAVTVAGTSGTTTITQQFLAVGFFSDQTVEDLTEQSSWTVIDADTDQAPVGAVFSQQLPGLLEMTNVPNASVNLTISASINQPGNPNRVGNDSTAVRVSH